MLIVRIFVLVVRFAVVSVTALAASGPATQPATQPSTQPIRLEGKVVTIDCTAPALMILILAMSFLCHSGARAQHANPESIQSKCLLDSGFAAYGREPGMTMLAKVYALSRSIWAPQAPSLASSFSKPRSR